MIESYQTELIPIHKNYSLITCGSNGSGLYIGNYDLAIDIQTLESLDIKTIITAATNLPLDYSNTSIKRHKVYHIVDNPQYDILKHFNECCSLIEKSLSIGGVLVHCAAGVSRSSTLVIAYLMRKNKMKFNQCLKYVKSKRKVAKPNPGFELQLIKYQHYLSSLNSITPKLQSIDKSSRKSLMVSKFPKPNNQNQSRRSMNKNRNIHNASLASSSFRISKPKSSKYNIYLNFKN